MKLTALVEIEAPKSPAVGAMMTGWADSEFFFEGRVARIVTSDDDYSFEVFSETHAEVTPDGDLRVTSHRERTSNDVGQLLSVIQGALLSLVLYRDGFQEGYTGSLDEVEAILKAGMRNYEQVGFPDVWVRTT